MDEAWEFAASARGRRADFAARRETARPASLVAMGKVMVRDGQYGIVEAVNGNIRESVPCDLMM